MLRTGLTTVAAVAGTTAALHPMLAAQAQDTAHAAAAGGTGAAAAAASEAIPLFDEVYRGRRIQGFTADTEDRIALFVDGRPLHVMRRADGSWISVANHFQPYATPVATARAAVDAIGSAQLATDIGHHH